MPIWLRRFTFQKLKAHFEELNKATKKNTSTKKNPIGPNIKPKFTSSRHKK